MRRHGRPEELVTDKLRSYGAALKELGAEDQQVTGRWENNRAENSHQPFRRCCQTNANSSQVGQVRSISVRAERPPLGKSGGSVQLEELAAREAPV